MQVQFNQYKYNYNNYAVKNSTVPSFMGQVNTMSERLAILLSDTKKLYQNKHNIEIKDFETIIKKISPTTKVKYFSEIPSGSNISPRTGAYFSQKTNFNPYTKELDVEDKIVYLNFNDRTFASRIKLLGDFVHEATHISQEEATDRQATIDLVRKMFYSSCSDIEKNHSLVGGVQGFKSVEYNILLPLIDALRKNDDIPYRVVCADKNILNMLYERTTNLSTVEYIKVVISEILKQLKMRFPDMNDNYVLQYIHKKAGAEKEAYKTSLDFLKDILKINGDTDLDLRILLYDEFEKTVKNMIK